MPFEKLYVDAWIISRLESDATLGPLVSGVFSELIPAGRDLPAVRLQLQAAPDQRGIGTHRISTRMTYLIVAVVDGPSPGPLVPVTNRMDELLQGARGESANIDVMSVDRTEVISYSTVEDGVRFWHVGGLYRFQVNQK